jgi:mannose-6-phosphate isomerase-like protein (cupin superfamily)
MDETAAGAAAAFATKQLGAAYDALAPDGSEIRLLAATDRGSVAHGTLPPDRVSLAVVHRTVEEIWYVTEGRGQVWREQDGHEEVVDVGPGTALTIPVGVRFQFRTTGSEPLRFIMCTMPPWPGAQEAVRVPDHWPTAETEDADDARDRENDSPAKSRPG